EEGEVRVEGGGGGGDGGGDRGRVEQGDRRALAARLAAVGDDAHGDPAVPGPDERRGQLGRGEVEHRDVDGGGRRLYLLDEGGQRAVEVDLGGRRRGRRPESQAAGQEQGKGEEPIAERGRDPLAGSVSWRFGGCHQMDTGRGC